MNYTFRILIPISLFASDDCIKGTGRFYQGKVNVTKDGIECQRWDSQLPHSYVRPPNVFPELHGAENYCRNAGGEVHVPWCFTTNSSVRWQYCNIPQCANSLVTIDGDISITMDNFLTPKFLIMISAIGLLSILLLMLSIILCHRLYKKQRGGYNRTDTNEVSIDLDKLPSNMAYHR